MRIPVTMKALQLRALGHLDEIELTVAAPLPGEVLVRTAATTICTSDIQDMLRNPFGTVLPRVLGHEGAGFVAALGEGVSQFRIGDRVAAHPVIPCGSCYTCQGGLGHLCERMGHLGCDRDGTFAEYFRMPACRVRHIPDYLDWAVGALLEPVCVCLEAVRRARITAGESVMVAGDGPFGILISRLALRERPRRLILVGMEEFRLRQMRFHPLRGGAGGAVTINAARVPNVVDAIRDANGGGGVDAAILAVASTEALDACVQSLRPRGRLVVFAGIADPVPIDLFRVHLKELEILGACNDEHLIDEALELLSEPALALESLVTHRIPFAEWRSAIELAAHGKDRALKVAITFGCED